jgi:hypothetical protein
MARTGAALRQLQQRIGQLGARHEAGGFQHAASSDSSQARCHSTIRHRHAAARPPFGHQHGGKFLADDLAMLGQRLRIQRSQSG